MKLSGLFLGAVCASFLISCQSKQKTEEVIQPNLQIENNAGVSTAPFVPAEVEVSKVEPTQSYTQAKIGLILGPGAMRSFAHVGVVTEFAKAKLPIHAIVGMEMGALVAAIYANKGQPYDVEWQMMKLKESDIVQKGLLTSSVRAGEAQSLSEFMNMSLSSARVESAKINFACPAFHIGKRQSFMMNKGVFTQMLPFCLAFPPLFKPYQQNIAGVFDLKPLIDYMKTKGVTYIVYVDLLSGNNRLDSASFETESLWSLAAALLAKQEKSVNEIVRVPLQDYYLTDFSRRREMMQKGQQTGIKAAQSIKRNLGL